MSSVIKLENIGKQYRLGLVGTNTLRGDITSWWYRMRGLSDPTLAIGQENRLDTQSGEYVWALRDINLEVQQGEVLGIIGKNGAGKSTLLKILSRVTGPTTGQIKVKGRIASLLEVGTGFHPELTGRENIFLNGAILGMTKTEIRSKFDEIVDFAGVQKYIDTPVKRYSSGMYVRLAFAVAAHLEPEILIVDEVLAVGDAEFQKKAIGKMQDISKGGGRTVLFVSHNMASVEKLCTRAILIENGQITLNDNTSIVVNSYLKRYKLNLNSLTPIINLSAHQNKHYNKNLGFIEAKLFCDKELNTTFYSGSEFRILISIKANKEKEQTKIGFVIKNEEGIALIGLNNSNIGLSFFTENNNGYTASITIPTLALYGAGYYYIDLFLGNNEKDFDIIHNAIVFYLKETDVYASGKLPYNHVNLLYVPNLKIELIQNV